MISSLIKKIGPAISVVTINKRLARYINSNYSQAMKNSGLMAWDSPHIVPVYIWLENLYKENCFERPLLSELHALVLWEKIVAKEMTALESGVLIKDGLEKRAYEAYKLMKDYEALLSSQSFASKEFASLLNWIEKYEKKLETLGFMERAELPGKILGALADKKITVPKNIIFAGFDYIDGSLEKLINELRANSCNVTFWPLEALEGNESLDLPAMKGKLSLRLYKDEREEVEQTAILTRKLHKEGKKIGVIVPQLGRYADLIRREFRAELNPPAVVPWNNQNEVFNISLGTTLLDSPIIFFIIKMLSFFLFKISAEDIGYILLSPFISASDDERQELARLDYWIKQNLKEISLSELTGLLCGEHCNAPEMKSGMDKLLKSIIDNKEKKLPSQWAGYLSELIYSISPGTVVIDSVEYQSINAWKKLLSHFAGLDDFTEKIDLSYALYLLSNIAKDTIHQSESAENSIEIMGLLESSGICFDYLFLLGAYEGALPATPSPNPFIPIRIQKRYDMPRSSNEREVDFSKAQLRRLFLCCNELYASLPEKADGCDTRISPLLAEINPEKGAAYLIKGQKYRDLIHCQAPSRGAINDELPDELPTELFGAHIPVSRNEVDLIKGGTSILKNQSDCPFKAFAVNRLSAKSFLTPESGLSEPLKGRIVHRVLENLWEDIQDSERLNELNMKGALYEVISRAVKKGLADEDPGRSISKRYIDVEKDRIMVLISEWLEVELKRGEFTSNVRETEKAMYFGDLEIKGRIDRIDDLKDGQKVLIDYKTSSQNTKAWLTARPKDPQLMIYAMAGEYDAVAFARLKRNNCAFAGIAKTGELLPGVKPFGMDEYSRKFEIADSWEELMEKWREIISSLASDFLDGNVKVGPRDFGKDDSPCRFCDLTVFCRIFDRE